MNGLEMVTTILTSVVSVALGYCLKMMIDYIKYKRSQKKDLLENLKRLHIILEGSKRICVKQAKKRNELYAILKKNHPNEITNGLGKGHKGYNDLFKRLYPIFTDREKELHSLIRGYSSDSMRRYNKRILDWLNEGYLQKIKDPTYEMIEFLKFVPQLRDHLNDWFAIYEGIFLHDEKYSLVYTGDEYKHGVGFPKGIEHKLQDAINSL